MGTGVVRNADTVRVDNPDGSSPYLLVCDHASNFIPPEYGTLGLAASELTRHIAWDPGALPVARMLSGILDATLIHSGVSRLIIDCNRPLDANNLFWDISEDTVVPGNQNLTAEERQKRIALAYEPFHAAIDAAVRERLANGRPTWVVSVHSFTPVYHGVARPWQIGIIHDQETRLAAPMIAALERVPGIEVGVNEPYSPADKVYFTLEKHARSRGLACAMIEIRNDEIGDEAGQRKWAERLGNIMMQMQMDLHASRSTAA